MSAAPLIPFDDLEIKKLPSRSEGQRRAALALNEKLKLEAFLLKKLQPLNGAILRGYKRKLKSSGRVLNVHAIYGKKLEDILLDHYELVSKKFMRSIRVQFGFGLSIEPVPDFLMKHFTGRAKLQAKRINNTTQEAAQRHYEHAKEKQLKARARGKKFGRQAMARLAGAGLERNLRGREEGIAILETQAPAEGSKLTQVELLYGDEPSLADAEFKAKRTRKVRKKKKVKMWNSLGDSRVRGHHLKADSQIVDNDKPFKVMGERLMYPGDTSLGASHANIQRCRCSVSYDFVFTLVQARGVGGMGAPGKKPLKQYRPKDTGPGPSSKKPKLKSEEVAIANLMKVGRTSKVVRVDGPKVRTRKQPKNVGMVPGTSKILTRKVPKK